MIIKTPLSLKESRGFVVFPLRIVQIRVWKLEVADYDLQSFTYMILQAKKQEAVTICDRLNKGILIFLE